MSFSQKESIRVGFYRFDRSESGIQVSTRLKELHPEHPPKIHYIQMMLGSSHYQTNLSTDPSHILKMVDSNVSSLLKDLNKKHQKILLWPLATFFGSVLTLFFLYHHQTHLALVSASCTLIGIFFCAFFDHIRKNIVLFYALDSTVEQTYKKLYHAGVELKQCSQMWHIHNKQTLQHHKERKYKAGAHQLYSRSRATIHLAPPPYLKTNIETFCIDLGTKKLYFLPDLILVYATNGVGAIFYDQLQSESQVNPFAEESIAPKDAHQIGNTWEVVNLDGRPDQRLNENKELPVFLYSELFLKTNSGLNTSLQFSQKSSAFQWDTALKLFSKTAFPPSSKSLFSSNTPSSQIHPLPDSNFFIGNTISSAFGLGATILLLLSLLFYVGQKPENSPPSKVSAQTQKITKQLPTPSDEIKRPFIPLKQPVEISSSKEEVFFRERLGEQPPLAQNSWKNWALEVLQKMPLAEQKFLAHQIIVIVNKLYPTVKEEQIRSYLTKLDEDMLFFTLEFQVAYGPSPQKKTVYQLKWALDQRQHQLAHVSPAKETEFLKLTPSIQEEIDSFFAQTYYPRFRKILAGQEKFYQELIPPPKNSEDSEEKEFLPSKQLHTSYYGRFWQKENRLKTENGSKKTEEAVSNGLNWLKRHQHSEGYWDADQFHNQCHVSNCQGEGKSWTDVGQTGLALLAFMGAGNTPHYGLYRIQVQKGLSYLLKVQEKNGCFGAQERGTHFIYNHTIATLALTEAYELSNKLPLYHTATQNGINFLLQAQNPNLGWRYDVQNGDNDTSITGWAVKALANAQHSGLNVPPEAFAGALNWLDSVTDNNTYRSGYMKRGDPGARLAGLEQFAPVESMSAAAALARILIGNHVQEEKKIQGVVELLQKELPKRIDDKGKSKIDYYYWYYGSLLVFQIGGGPWKVWNTHLIEALLPHQKKSGCEQGSWDPIGAWGSEGGRVYSTALNVITLETYYRYNRIFKIKTNLKIAPETSETPLHRAFRQIKSKFSKNRIQAVLILKQSSSSKAVEALIKALRDSHHEVQREATKALGEMAIEPEKVVPALITTLKKTYLNIEIEAPRRRLVVGVNKDNDETSNQNNSLNEAKQQLALLKQQQIILRQDVLQALSTFGSRAMKAAPAIMNVIEKEEQEEIRILAQKVLEKIIVEESTPFSDPPLEADLDTKKTISVLLEWLDKNQETFQQNAILFIGRIGQKANKSMSRLLKMIDSPQESIRSATLYAISRMGPSAEEAIPKLLEKLQDSDVSVQVNILKILQGIGPQAKEAIPALLECINDSNSSIRTQAMLTLFAIGISDDQIVALLVPKLADPEETVRIHAAWILSQSILASKTAAPALRRSLQDASAKVRLYAKEALTKIEPETNIPTENFLSKKDFSNSPRPSSSQNSIESLSSQEESLLKELLAQGYPEKTASALKQLQQFSNAQQSKIIAVLFDIIQEKDSRWEMRNTQNQYLSSGKANAIRALKILKSEFEFSSFISETQTIPLLLKTIRDREKTVRQETIHTLISFKSFSPEIVFTMMQQLQREQESTVRQTILKAFGEFGQHAEIAIPKIVEYFQDSEEEVRASAIFSLAQMHATSQKVLPLLVELLRDSPSKPHREAVIQVLGILGAEVQEVIPLLVHLSETEPSLTSALQWAIAKIDPKALSSKKELDEPLLQQNNLSDENTSETIPNSKNFIDISLFFVGGIIVLLGLTAFYNSSQKFTFYENLLASVSQEYTKPQIPQNENEDKDIANLLANLNHIGPLIRADAIRTLGEQNILEAVPILRQKLKDSSKTVSQEAAIALGKMNELNEESILILLEALHDTKMNMNACNILKDNGTIVLPILLQILKETQHPEKEYAAWILGEIGIHTEEVALVLTKALKDPNKKVLHYAARALKKIPLGQKVVPSLIELLQDSDEAIRRESAEALGDVGPEAASAVPILIRTLQDPSSQVRICAMWALGNIGKEAQIAGASLLLALHEGNGKEQQWAAGALAMIGLYFKESEPFLQHFISRRIQKLKDTTWFIRKMAAQALGNLGIYAKEAIPSLQVALKDENEFVRKSALNALLQIKKSTAEKTIPFPLEPKEAFSPEDSAEIQPVETHIYDHLDLEILEKSPQEDVEIKDLTLLQTSSIETIPTLLHILNDPNSVFQNQAQELLQKHSSSQEAIPSLIAALTHTNKQIREFAASALKDLGGVAKVAVPNLIEALKDQSHSVRKEAIQALGSMQIEAIDAEPLLREIIEKDPVLDSFAKEALAQIVPETFSPEQRMKIENLQGNIITVLQARFQEVPETIRATILKTTQVEILQQFLEKSATVDSLETLLCSI